jgi:hypothetical protein
VLRHGLPPSCSYEYKIGGAVLLGTMAFIPRNTPFEPGHNVADVCYGQIETCARHLMRWPNGRYALRRIAADFERPLAATRTMLASLSPMMRQSVSAVTMPIRRRRTTQSGSRASKGAALGA